MRYVTVLLGLVVVVPSATAHAQFGRLIKEGIEAGGKRMFGRGTREAAEESGEQAAKRAAGITARELGQESAEAATRGAVRSTARSSAAAAQAVGRHGSAVATPLLNQFGDDAAEALARLSPDQARRMAILTEDLAAGGRGADWMRVLAEKGDIAADWIWRNKGTITVATTATAFLANPEAFLQAAESVANQGIETAGTQVARPLIEGTAQAVLPKVTEVALRPVVVAQASVERSPGLWFGVALVMAILAWLGYRWQVRPWLRLVGLLKKA